MRENKDARLEIRIPVSVKEQLKNYAEQQSITISHFVYQLILSALKDNNNGPTN